MTFFAFYLGVTACQREARFIMVVRDALPTLLVMTTLALIAELILVLVVLAVTRNALAFQFFLLVKCALLR